MSSPDLHRTYKASDVLEEVLCYINSCIQETEVMKACSNELLGCRPIDIDYDKELEHLDKRIWIRWLKYISGSRITKQALCKKKNLPVKGPDTVV